MSYAFAKYKFSSRSFRRFSRFEKRRHVLLEGCVREGGEREGEGEGEGERERERERERAAITSKLPRITSHKIAVYRSKGQKDRS